MLGPGLRDVIAMGDAVGRLHEHHAAGPQRLVHALGDRDAAVAEHLHQFLVVPLGVAGIGRDEEAGPVFLDPGRELVEFAVDGVEQEHAADTVGDAADLEAPGGRQEAAAIADDHDRQVRECLRRFRIAVEAGEVARRFIDEALEAARLPEFAGRGIGGVHRELRREQHGVDAGIRDLLRHQLPVADVALQRRAVAVEEHHDHAGLPGVERLGDMHQHAVVVVGLVLPIDPAAKLRWPLRSPLEMLRNGSSERGLVPK